MVAASLLWSAQAAAGGFVLPGRGAGPFGRASTMIASHEGDLNSIWFNPANLALVDRLTLTVDLSVVHYSLEHQRAPRMMPNGDLRFYESIRNDAFPNTIPQILVGGPTGVEGLVWSVGLYAPYAGATTFPDNGPQRYVLIDNVGSFMLYLHGAVGWQVTDWLRVGAGIQNFMAGFRLVNVTSGYIGVFGDPEDEDLDILLQVSPRDFFSLTGNLGAAVSLGERFVLGTSFQLPSELRDRQTPFEARLPDHPAFDNAEVQGDTVDMSVKVPWFARLGLRYHEPRFDLELSLVYEAWSTLDNISVTPNEVSVTGVPMMGSISMGPMAIPQRLQDTLSVSFGGEYRPTDAWKFRGGYTFEPTAVPDENASVFATDSTKNVFALGASRRFEDLSVDLMAAYIHMATRDITTSQVYQINTQDEENRTTLVVGNGTYRSSYVLWGLGVNYRF
jgi:long-chain fatty acid transport protein